MFVLNYAWVYNSRHMALLSINVGFIVFTNNSAAYRRMYGKQTLNNL